MADYSVSCECGRGIAVTLAQAGDSLSCTCNREVLVPRMSELRKSAGESAIPLSIAERICKLVTDGSLPTDDLCPLTLRPSDYTLMVRVNCERAWLKSGADGTGERLILGMLFGVFGMLMTRQTPRDAEHHGRDTTLDLPLRISADARSKYYRQSRKQLISLLSKTPIYAELFEEYPDAKLKVLKQSSS